MYHYLLYSHHTITCKVHGWRMLARCLPDRLSRCSRSRLCWLSVRQSCLGCIILHFVGITIRVRTSFRFSSRPGLFPTTIKYKGLQNTTSSQLTLPCPIYGLISWWDDDSSSASTDRNLRSNCDGLEKNRELALDSSTVSVSKELTGACHMILVCSSLLFNRLSLLTLIHVTIHPCAAFESLFEMFLLHRTKIRSDRRNQIVKTPSVDSRF